MYHQHFSLSQRPFFNTPTPDCIFQLPAFVQAFSDLEREITFGDGLSILTGPNGCGKSLLLMTLKQALGVNHPTALLSTSGYATRSALLQTILFELDQPYTGLREQELRLNLLGYARRVAEQGRSTLILIDEAHLLYAKLFEELRALSLHVVNERPLFRIVLAGPMELEEQISSNSLSEFSQRIGCYANLDSLNREETIGYIAHRITRAGGELREIIAADALELIARASDGVPRMINMLCDQAFLVAYSKDLPIVTLDVVEAALDDLEKLPLHWNRPIATRPAEEQLIARREYVDDEELPHALEEKNDAEDNADDEWSSLVAETRNSLTESDDAVPEERGVEAETAALVSVPIENAPTGPSQANTVITPQEVCVHDWYAALDDQYMQATPELIVHHGEASLTGGRPTPTTEESSHEIEETLLDLAHEAGETIRQPGPVDAADLPDWDEQDIEYDLVLPDDATPVEQHRFDERPAHLAGPTKQEPASKPLEFLFTEYRR